MHAWLHTYKPSASRQTHLLLAALMWSIVGTALLVVGTRWMWRSHVPFKMLGPALAIAAMLGWVKAHFALDRVAGHVIERIRTRGDGRCLGGFLSVQTWGLVVLMVVSGRLFRALPIPMAIVGFVYAIVGTALLVASRYLWRAWRSSSGRSSA